MIDNSTHANVLFAKSYPKTCQAVFAVAASDPVAINGDLSALPQEARRGLELLAAHVSKGKSDEVSSTVVESGKSVLHASVVGVGKTEEVTAEELRKAGASIYRAARKAKQTDVVVLVPSFLTVASGDVAEAITTGAMLASFEFRDYVGSRRAKDFASKQDVRVHLIGLSADAQEGITRGTVISHATNFARTIASRPGNDINPVTLAQVAGELAKEVGLKITVIDEKQMKKMSMGGLLGVGGGSATPPRLIALEHKPAKSKSESRPLLVVGKSITFDTGGISIKPADKMQRMIYDKSGGMAVLGLMYALAKLKVPAHVVGVLTAAENHVSGTSYRPGDVLTMYNGITVEITNTDAEGRLVLGDAIAWGIDTYKPAAVVDLATLTGGCVVALGQTMAGLFSNNDALAAEIDAAGKAAGEKMWRLPVGDEQRDMMKSDLADILNSAGRYASPLTGAAFVSFFVPTDGSTPWVHLDIAGVADTEKELPYLGKGSTGYGVRTLVNWVESKAGQR